jgi:protein-S-isoprenylcysteine O-methyltransferase Ste14
MLDSSRLPDLGTRGGGWVGGQALLLLAVALSALVGVGPVLWSIVPGALVAGLGVGVVVAGAAALGSALTPYPRPREGAGLRELGLYSLVRHPIYGGVVLVAAGWSLFWRSPLGGVLTLVLLLFFTLKARREEAWLEQRYPEYAAYRRRTPRRFIPYVW